MSGGAVKIRYEINFRKPNGGRRFEPIQTMHEWGLYEFPQEKQRDTDIRTSIDDAMNHIATHCARNRDCNHYFHSLGPLTDRDPITLAGILKRYEIRIYCLRYPRWSSDTDETDLERDKDAPGAYTVADQGDKIARIGINRLHFASLPLLTSTLVHELAHVAGAPGKDVDPNSLAAETANLHCLTGRNVKISDIYDPDAKG